MMLTSSIRNENNDLEDFIPIYIAPYISNTHTCSLHAESCAGELPNILIRYNISSNDNIVQMVGETFTKSNGFLTLYVPVNKSYNIQMKASSNDIDYEGNSQFEAYKGNPNCITTGQLIAL
ncbi:MAG: CueP family metal-binding protein [Promethearchaeota archaeon]|jgi:hypothetical protein